MHVARSEFLPDAALDREAMESLQREVARAATFHDDLPVAPAAVALEDALSLDRGADASLDDSVGDGPVVVGVDQAFPADRDVAVSAAVALRDGRVVERSVAEAPLEFPYVPGLLSFREAPAVVAALRGLDAEPALLVLDGSGRIHFRQAGIATHVGVLFDAPAVGVAKNLLCGTPARSLDGPLPAGERVPIRAGDGVDPVSTAGDWPVVGHAYQSRQFSDTARRHVNPLYVSPGHRVGAGTAIDLVGALSAGYKLPEPTRLADAAVAGATE